CRGLVDERHGADAARLRRALGAVRVAAADVDEALREINVAPAERAELAEAEVGEGGDAKDGGVLFVLRCAGERLDFSGLQHREFAGASERLPVDERSGVRA